MAGLARSTFYYQQQALQVKDKHTEMKAMICTLFEQHQGRYGYRRITLGIRQMGLQVNHKTIQRLMRQLQLKSRVRIKKYCAYKGSLGRIAPNLLHRQFSAQRLNQKWVTDITEFNVAGQKLYLSPVMDLYNAEIIAYESATSPAFQIVSSMLKKAYTRLGNSDKPIMHSDQGWHYQIPAYRALLAQKDITQSMSRKGNCLDNAAMESFFGTLKSEFFYLNKFQSIDELQAGLDSYIHYYNHDRIKLKLGGLSPVQFRIQTA